jgi:hypothetical protein
MGIIFAILVTGQCSGGSCAITPSPFISREIPAHDWSFLLQEWQAMESVDTSDWEREERLAHNRKKTDLKRKLQKIDQERRMAMIQQLRQQEAWQERVARKYRLQNKQIYYPNLGALQSQVQAATYWNFYNSCYTGY